MKILVVLAIVALVLATVEAARPLPAHEKLIKILNKPELKAQLKKFETALKLVSKIPASPQKLGNLSVECALCGIAINELEGFIAENISEQEMEILFRSEVCSMLSGLYQALCDDLANQIPTIISMFENRWGVSQVCVDLGYCTAPFTPFPDPQPVPKFTVNLDLPPNQRWLQVCSVPSFQAPAQFLVGIVNSLLPDNGAYLEDIGYLINTFYFPAEYAAEISGCASVLGIPVGWATLFNIGYEVTDACTSIVAQTNDGKIYHARNLDFWAGMGFTDSLKNMTAQITFTKSGNPLFVATSFAGYVGILSGMKPNAFSVTIDTRFYPGGLSELFYELVAAIIEQNASMVSFLTRDVFTNQNDFDSAVYNLANVPLIADVYYIVAGVRAGQGAVISRNRLNATDIWMLNVSAGRWFEVETNYDHWENPPWFDNRVVPANNAMTALGRNNLSLPGMLQVLSVKPVLNIQTTYSILASPADSSFTTYTRWCPYPCVE